MRLALVRLLIVAVMPHGGTAAHIYSGAGRLLLTVEPPPQAGLSPAWSPDGSRIAWSNKAGIWVENADGTGVRRLLKEKTVCTASCTSGAVLAWSNDGSTLVAGGVDPKDTGMVAIDLRTGRTTPLVKPRPYGLYFPIAFSPDGTKLSFNYFYGDPGTASCCKSQLRVMNADGSNNRLLFNFSESIHDSAGQATWSPDGTHIAFTDDARDPKDPGFAIVDVATGAVHPMPSSRAYDQSPQWSPDGTRLAMARYEADAFTIGVDGKRIRSLGRVAGLVKWLSTGDILFAGANERSLSTGSRRLFTLPRSEQLLSVHEAS